MYELQTFEHFLGVKEWLTIVRNQELMPVEEAYNEHIEKNPGLQYRVVKIIYDILYTSDEE